VNDPNPEPSMQSGAVDSHCHLFLLDGDPAEAVEQARAAGVDTLVCVGIDPESSRRSVALAETFPGVYATAGMHPHDASAFDARAGAEIEELLTHPRVVAVGECGLDFFRMRSPRPEQERTLAAQLTLSKAYEILRVLDEGSAERVVLHCFSGDAEIARGCADRGWFLSFAGNVTYPKNAHLREAAAAVPLERLLVETDSPFLPPQRLRGRDNTPSNVVEVIDAIATAREEPVETVRETTAANARMAFPRLREGPLGDLV
jgi:TatD DNase family protein